ncbi:hypothetical protein IU500_35345 [Nocardia terpenica]|uniref:hypothetical protein n=1 Tax=Nocardia terpenica TaxID=455432 RepID=UPI00189335C3|nr:hypothetical protein [Nocardia terpenica]MBF6066191.1 hypothetical protein [Nocardia terpenica]MBF6109291.1 hypothetical protein [Nocardia terpenica]MBF6116403.1 hypothetical protein [Nocardia terpenica]MBF6123592.1 hypothetical protein [Nocardia terpenica]MBF6156836.1 hypothetical protein [Nocardia terpenica]
MIEAEYKARLTDADAVRKKLTDRHLLTFKDPAVDSGSGSKPEFETDVKQRDMMEQIVTVSKIDGTFLELETHVDATDDLDGALADLRTVLTTLGVSPDQSTSDQHSLLTAPAPGRDASALLDIRRRGPYPANRGCYRDCGRFGQRGEPH